MRNNKNLWMYICGRFISLIGSGIQTIALPLYILDLTGSGTLMGVFSVLILLPSVLSAPFSGIVGDRRNRRSVMIAMDCGRGVLVCILGILAAKQILNISVLFIMQAFISIMDSLFNASSTALMPDLIRKDQFIEANSAKGGLDAASTILGPILGGLIYGMYGIKTVFYINGISFIVSAVFSTFITYNRKAIKNEKIDIKMVLKDNSEVFKFIWSKKGLLQLFTFAMLANFLIAPLFDVVMPFVLRKEVGFNSQQYGYIMSFLAAGILFGNAAILFYFKKLGLKKLMRYGFVIETSLRVMVCALTFPYIIRLYGGANWFLFISISVCCMVMEFFNAFVNTSISTNLQNLVSEEMRSRFFAILGVFSQCAMPLGALLFGILLDKIEYYTILIIINAALILAVIVFLTKAGDEAYEAKDCSLY